MRDLTSNQVLYDQEQHMQDNDHNKYFGEYRQDHGHLPAIG